MAGSKVIDGEISQDSSARLIRDGKIIFNGKIGSIFREKNQAKQVSAGLECGITLKDFSDFQKQAIIEVYNSTILERSKNIILRDESFERYSEGIDLSIGLNLISLLHLRF